MDLNIKDESMDGSIRNEFVISIPNKTIRVKELIQSRVYHEVETFNKTKTDIFEGLVQPLKSEMIEGQFNRYRWVNKDELIDAEKQYYLTLNAFQKNSFFMLIDNIQVTDLEQEVLLQENISVSFVRLIALIGG